MAEEPVEIDIILRQNVEDEGAKATRAIDKMAEASEEAWKRSKEALQMQRDVIARLKKELEPLQSAFDKVNIGTTDPKVIAERERLSKAVRSVATELKGEEAALKEMMGTSDKVQQKGKSLETQMRAVREEMSAMALAGKKESTEYREKEQQLGTLSTAYREVYNTQTQLQKGGANLQGIVSGLGAISGLLSAGAGAFGLFNSNSEEFNAIQTKMQSLMAMTIGLQQVQNTLHQTSAFRIQTVTKAKQMWTSATNRLTVALGISNAAAKVLMGTLTVGLSVAIGFAINTIDKYISKQKEAKEEQNKLNESIVKNSAEQIANHERLRTSYNQLGDDIKAKEQFILENQDAFKQLGVSIHTVNDADNLFIRQTGAFLSAIDMRARATAAMELAAEKYKASMQKQSEANERERNPNAWEQLTSVSDFFDKDGKRVLRNKKAKAAADKMRAEAQKDEQDAQKLVNQYVLFENKAAEQLKQAGFEASDKLVEGTKAWWEAKKKNAQARLDALTDAQKGTIEWKAIENEITESDVAIKKFDTKPNKKLENARKQANKKLKELDYDTQKEIDVAVVAAMKEGRDKKLAELKADYDARKSLIEKRKQEIEELEKTTGVDGSKQKEQLSILADAEAKKYTANVDVITNGAKKALATVQDEINSRFRTQNENRIEEIHLFYKEQTQKAKENGATQAELDKIALLHKKDVEWEKRQIALETLDFEAMIAIKRAQIEDRHVLLQSEREEKILRVQIEAMKKRIAKLQEMKAAGQDVEKDIAAATVELQGMNAEMERVPLEKMQELADLAQQIGGIFSEIAGMSGGSDAENLADMLGSYFGGTANVGMGVARAAMGDPQGVQQALGGLKQVFGAVKKIITANKEANKEIREFHQSLAQQAVDYSLAVIRSIKDIKGEADSLFFYSYTNTLTQGMAGYNAALNKQAELMAKLGAATVKTGVEKKKFLGITYGTRDVYSNLLKQYPDLIKKDGTLNRELAESLKKSGNLKEETADLIDNILQASDAANEAMQSVESELQNLVGSIGSELKKALDDAFSSGTDSAKAMTDNVVKMLKELSTQKLYNAVFGGLFSELEKRMKESYGATGDHDLTDDIDWFMENYPDLVDSYNKGLSELQKKIQERYGVDAFATDDGRKAVNKGIAQASQDSIDELNGRLTFLVMKVSDIGAINVTHADLSREQLLVQRAMLGSLETIAENSEFLKKLNGIAEDIAKMNRDGIILKR